MSTKAVCFDSALKKQMEESRSVVTVPPNGEQRIVEWAECECHHRWVIEFPYGSISKGVCQQCGESMFDSEDIKAIQQLIKNLDEQVSALAKAA